MNLALNQQEIEVLQRALSMFLSDLRMEIAGTENYDFRQGLKQDEEILKGVLEKLGVHVAGNL